MRLAIALLLPLVSVGTAFRNTPKDPPPGLTRASYRRGDPSKGDSRSPCPAINTLANHGILPRNGKNITTAQFVAASAYAYNFQASFTELQVSTVLTVLNQSTLSLSDLSLGVIHDVEEHDASLSRYNLAQGDNHTPQPCLVHAMIEDASTSAHKDYVSLSSMAISRNRRFTENAEAGAPAVASQILWDALTESSLVLQALAVNNEGDPASWVLPKPWVWDWFVEERFPDGWKVPVANITLDGTEALAAVLLTEMGKNLSSNAVHCLPGRRNWV